MMNEYIMEDVNIEELQYMQEYTAYLQALKDERGEDEWGR
jgi:hypothetical protein